MKKSILILFSIVLVIGLFVISVNLVPEAKAAEPKVIKWRVQNIYGGTTFKEIGGQSYYLADKIKKLTGGRLLIEVSPPGAIVPPRDVFAAVSRGTIQGALDYYPGFHTGLMPETDIEIGMPYAWSHQWEAADAFMNYGLLERFQKIYAEHNIYYLAPIFYESNYSIMTTFPIASPEDLKGKKMRAAGIYGDFVKGFGGAPTVLPWGEMYMALKLGTVDGAIMGPGALDTEKLQEVFKYIVTTPSLNTVVGCQIVNMNAWKALPDDIRAILDQVVLEITSYCQMRYCASERHILFNAIKNHKIKQVIFTGAEVEKAMAVGVTLWDKIAANSPRCAELVGIVKQQARDLAKIK